MRKWRIISRPRKGGRRLVSPSRGRLERHPHTVRSELGEPIHKIATRGVKLWKEMDDTIFGLPKDKRAAALLAKKDYIIKRLNADFQKVTFALCILICLLCLYSLFVFGSLTMHVYYL